LQIEGTVAGIPVYYRARHYRWEVHLGDLATSISERGKQPPESLTQLAGSCSGEEEVSLSFAMARIFAASQILRAVMDVEIEEDDAAQEQAWAAFTGAV
jgi:hypothetical protein